MGELDSNGPVKNPAKDTGRHRATSSTANNADTTAVVSNCRRLLIIDAPAAARTIMINHKSAATSYYKFVTQRRSEQTIFFHRQHADRVRALLTSANFAKLEASAAAAHLYQGAEKRSGCTFIKMLRTAPWIKDGCFPLSLSLWERLE